MTSSISSLLMVIGLWLTLAFFCCGGADKGIGSYTVIYRVDGSGPAHVTYSNATGGTEMREVRLPWTETFDGRYGEHLYVSAQSLDEYGSPITASISVNGRIIKDATSNGRFSIATVSDMCCSEY